MAGITKLVPQLTTLPAASVEDGSLPVGVLPYISASATNAAYKMVFAQTAGDASGNQSLLIDDGTFSVTYNPSTGDLNSEGKLQEGGNDLIPSGTILAFGSTSTPAGYLECNGQAVSRSTYATLFSVISTTYGVGDGSTTFNVPDTQSRSLMGEDGTNAIGTQSTAAGASTTVTSGSTAAALSVGNTTVAATAKDSSTTAVVNSVNSTGHTHDIVMPVCVVQHIIKT